MPSVVFRCERGTLAFYVAVVIPLVCSLAVLAVDVSQFQSLRESAQQEADRIVLHAVKALPDTYMARRIVENSVLQHPKLQIAKDEQGQALVEISRSKISLTIQGSVDIFFNLFMRKDAAGDSLFSLYEKSEAQVVPVDFAIVLADGESLRPRVSQAWGTQKDWPASKYFSFVHRPDIPSDGENIPEEHKAVLRNADEHWDSGEFQRWATQNCYNPVYSSLKYAAISLIDMLGTQDTNRVSVLFSPGQNPEKGFDSLGELNFPKEGGIYPEAKWQERHRSELLISDESCVYFADSKTSDQARYELTLAPWGGANQENGHPFCHERLFHNGWGGPYYPYAKLSDCITKRNILLREAVYYHAVQRTPHNSDAKNISRAINQAIIQLVGAQGDEVDVLQSKRGNLAAGSHRKIFVFSDRIPHPGSSGFAEILQRLDTHGITLVLLAYMPEEIYGRDAFKETKQEMDEAIKAFSKLGKRNIKTFTATNQKELAVQVVPKLISLGREFAIKT